MRKALFDELVQSVKEMKAIRAGALKPGRVSTSREILERTIPDVARLRRRFKLSQAKFATLLGISVNTLQNWEQGRRTPEGPARVLLRIALTHPEALLSTQRPNARSGKGRTAA